MQCVWFVGRSECLHGPHFLFLLFAIHVARRDHTTNKETASEQPDYQWLLQRTKEPQDT